MPFDLDQPMRGAPIAVFDVETTGSTDGDRICEIGVVLFDRFFEDPPRIAICKLVNPEIEGQWQGTRVHGIRDHHCRSAPTWAELWPEVAEVLDTHLPVAYNAPFDLRFLRIEATNICSALPLPSKESTLDLLPLVKRLDPGKGKGYHSLSSACERRGIKKGGHRAGSDAMATATLMQRLFSELYRRKDLSPPPKPTVAQFMSWLRGPARGETQALLTPVAMPLPSGDIAGEPSHGGGARLLYAVRRYRPGHGTLYLTEGRGVFEDSFRFTLHVKGARRFATEAEAQQVADAVLRREPLQRKGDEQVQPSVVDVVYLKHLARTA